MDVTPIPGFDPAPFRARREKLAQALGEISALIPAGRSKGRNFPANAYPFRASSHFLHLFGLPIEGAVGWLDGSGRTCVYRQTPDPADALWHGPPETHEALEGRMGVSVRPLEELERDLEGIASPIGLLPSSDASTDAWLAALVGRAPKAPPSSADRQLRAAIVECRLRHDRHAIDQIEAAVAVTEAAHRAGMRATRPGGTESAVRAAMEAVVVGAGMTTAYPPIVTVHGEILHDPFAHRPTAEGELLLADFGAESHEGYAADVTRTWPVSGRFDGPARDLYQWVLEAQERALDATGPGARFRDVHLAAGRAMTEGLVELGILRGDPAALFEDHAFALFFPHGVGHLLGLDVHDMEDLGDAAGYPAGTERDDAPGLRHLRLDRELEPNMVVTIEPGFYRVPAILDGSPLSEKIGDALDRDRLSAFESVRGIRIEDDVRITENGVEILSADLPRAPEAIEAIMAGG